MDHHADITLNGSELSLEDIVAIGTGEKKVRLEEAALQRCRESRSFLKGELDAGRIIYGVNTSFGPMCKNIIHQDEMERLQLNLVRSHAAGLGEPLSPAIALSVLAVRLNSLVKGYSGVSIELLEHIKGMINLGIAPYIPECGSVGASGDLVHLAHAALNIIGEGRVFYKGEWSPTQRVFEENNLSPFKLGFKEGLALTNGTSAMTAIAAFALVGAKKLLRAACASAAFAVEIFGGIDDAFDPDLHQLKPHPGQIKIAGVIRSLVRGSENITQRKDLHDRIRKPEKGDTVSETLVTVQDVYSLRCTPQILAPVVETIESAVRVVELEANSCNDNPVIDSSKKKIIHGGNFHGESVAVAADILAIVISKLSTLSERRLNKLLDKSLSEGLPEHLIVGPVGLNLGFMGAQFLATSTTAELRHLANPVSIHSISCNASNQDVVSMGTIAARKALQAVECSKHILTLELLADLQALSLKKIRKMGEGISSIYEKMNREFTPYDNTLPFHDLLVRFRDLIFSSRLFESLNPFLDDPNYFL